MKLTPKGICDDIEVNYIRQSGQHIEGFETIPDMDWKEKDINGHTHKWHKCGENYNIPTADKEQMEEEENCGECGHLTGETTSVTIFVCKKCGAEIEPKYTSTHCSRIIGGISSELEGTMHCNHKESFNFNTEILIEDLCEELQGKITITEAEPAEVLEGGHLGIQYKFVASGELQNKHD